MSTLQLAAAARNTPVKNKAALLYKKIIKEIPNVMMIYDMMDKPVEEVKQAVRSHFYKYKDIKDERVINMLLETGYFHLEETLLQHKQKNHVMVLLEGRSGSSRDAKTLSKDASIDEQFLRGL